MKRCKKFTHAAFGAALMVTGSAYACSDYPYIGSICVMAGNYCPANGGGWIKADGRNMPISEYSALFAVIGNYYGGDARVNFNLPDLRGRSPIGYDDGPGMQYGLPYPGLTRGKETTTLSVYQMPTHSHLATFIPTDDGIASSAQLEAVTDSSNTEVPVDGAYLATGKTGMSNSKNYYVGTPSGTATLNGLSGGGSGGVVTVKNNGGSQAFGNFPPQLAVTYCIASEGLFPSRP